MQGYKMAVVSNKNSLMLRREIEHFGFDNFFGAIVGADDVEDSKPSPTPAITALEKLDTKAGQDVWFVGDNVVDWMCANAASCQPVRIWPNEKQSISIPKGTLSVKNFENLRDIIEKL
jgi:phosphoglycolate phosphatase